VPDPSSASQPDSGPSETPGSTQGREYAERRRRRKKVGGRRVLDAHPPYRANLRRLARGRVLDVGCGIGRNLVALRERAVGVDHNPDSVLVARERGCVAYTVEEFRASEHAVPGSFDTLLLAHVVEHMPHADAVELVRGYLPQLAPGGRLLLICPQEKGYATDATHVEFADFAALRRLCTEVGAEPEREASFPLPRAAGRWFPYNEFVVTARLPG
jgi:SAM-dependent methyltransferase